MRFVKKGFTLVEVLVVLFVIGMVMAIMTTSFMSAQEKAKVEKAEAEVRSIHEAILSYQNFDEDHELPTMKDQDADKTTLGFLLGDGGSNDAGKIPATLMAQIESDGSIRDPWGTPYKVSISEGNADIKITSKASNMKTGYHLPNFYRLSAEERK